MVVIIVQDVCLVNVEYDIRGTIIRYIRSCQPLQDCAYVTNGICGGNRDRCCSQAPDRCLCRPGNQGLLYAIATFVSHAEVNIM